MKKLFSTLLVLCATLAHAATNTILTRGTPPNLGSVTAKDTCAGGGDAAKVALFNTLGLVDWSCIGTITLSGDASGSSSNGAIPVTLGPSGVTAGTYGSATQSSVVTVDAKGRVTAASSTTISGVAPGGAAGGDLTGTYPNPNVTRTNGVAFTSTATTASTSTSAGASSAGKVPLLNAYGFIDYTMIAGSTYYVEDFGTPPTAVCSGSDDFSAVQGAINAAATSGGGEVRFPARTCRVNSQITIPNDGASPIPHQYPLLLKGAGAHMNGSGVAAPYGGTVLDLRSSAVDGKVVSYGLGELEIRDITFFDGGTNSNPYLLIINSTPRIYDNAFIGNLSKSGTTCDQDAIVIGGTTHTFGGGPTNAFQGYNPIIAGNFFDRVQRAVYARVDFNAGVIRDNFVFQNAGSALSGGAAIELDGGVYTATGNLISGNSIELDHYTYGIKLANGSANIVVGNPGFDAGGATAVVRVESTSTRNIVIPGLNGGATQYLSDAAGTTCYLSIDPGHPSTCGPMQAFDDGGVPSKFPRITLNGGDGHTLIQPDATQAGGALMLESMRSALEGTCPSGKAWDITYAGDIDFFSASSCGSQLAQITNFGRNWQATGSGGAMLQDSGSGGSTYTAKNFSFLMQLHSGTQYASFSNTGINLTPASGGVTGPDFVANGTGGAGYFEFQTQSSKPGTPGTSNLRMYADASGRLSWIGSNGFVRTLDGTANTADRTYILPDAPGTLYDTGNVPNLTTTNGALKGSSGTISQAACADLSNAAASCSTDTTNANNILSGVLSAARGGAGTVNGIEKADSLGNVSAATIGTDYGRPPDIQVFTSNGTWTKPSGAKWVQVYAIGPGGPGGSGRRGASGTIVGGGAGGGGGGCVFGGVPASSLGSTVSVTVPAGGIHGNAQTVDSTDGNPGSLPSGSTQFGSQFLAARGGLGAGGTAGASTGGGGGAGILTGGAGGNGSATGLLGANGTNANCAGGGAAGGGITTGNAASAGGTGGIGNVMSTLNGAGAAGSSGGGGGGQGTVATATNQPAGGGGGGGGGSNTGGTGGTGGACSGFGSGGGGGGASANGNNSGAGADGCAGVVIVVTTDVLFDASSPMRLEAANTPYFAAAA